MALKTYRRQTSLGLQSSVNCPTCSSGSYRTVGCFNGTIRYVSKTAGWDGSQNILLAYVYIANDVVWIKDGANGSIECATVTGSVSDPAGTYKIDEAANGGNGAYGSCDPGDFDGCVVP